MARYVNVSNGFSIGTDAYVDERLLLTKAQMKEAEDEFFMPQRYIAYCLDDKQWYEYNEGNTVDAQTGKFRAIPNGIVQDVKIDGVSIVDAEGVADFDIPVMDVRVNGASVVQGKKAEIDLTGLQKKLTPGSGIAINNNNVISSTVPAPKAGTGVNVAADGTISVNNAIVPYKTELPNLVRTLGTEAGFITKSVLNLENYYLKSQTYTKQEVNDLLNSITGGVEMEVVAILPATGKASTIYMVRRALDSNVFDEYIWYNNGWVQVGSTEVDLSQYYNKTEVDNLLAQKQNNLQAGQGITITGNTISANVTELPEATSTRLGAIKYDNVTIKKNEDGQLYTVNEGGDTPIYYEGKNIYFTSVGKNTLINADDYTGGPGITVSSGKQIRAKVDDETIHINSNDELYMDAVAINPGDGIKIVDGTITVNRETVPTKSELDQKQDRLTAGDNIRIVNNIISAVGGGGGEGASNWGEIYGNMNNQKDLMAALDRKANVSEIPSAVSQLRNDVPYATDSSVRALETGKQDKLTAGANITISADNVISATGSSGPTEINWTDLKGNPLDNSALKAQIDAAKASPVVNEGSFTFKANNKSVGGVMVNQATSSSAGITLQMNGEDIEPVVSDGNATYNIEIPEEDKPGDGLLTIKQGGTTLGNFSANQETDKVIEIPEPVAPNNGVLTIKQNGVTKGTFSANQGSNTEVNITSPDVPTVGDGVLTIKQDGVTKGTFSANQSGNAEVNITSPTLPQMSNLIINQNQTHFATYNPLNANDTTINFSNYKITLKYGNTTLGSFTLNQVGDKTITIPASSTPGNGVLTIKQDGVTRGTFSANQATASTIDLISPEVNDGKLTIMYGDSEAGVFTANQDTNSVVKLPVIPTFSYDETTGVLTIFDN